VQGRFGWPGQLFGTVCPLTLRRLIVCQFFVIVLKIICSLIRIQALLNNCTIFYRGLEVFYIALGHVNPIENYYYYYYYNSATGGFSYIDMHATTSFHYIGVN